MLELYKDKALHFVAGLIVGSLVLLVARHIAPPPENPFFAVIGAAFAGACKEGWDYLENKRNAGVEGYVPQSVSLWDALATTAGGLLVAVLYSLHNR